MLQVGTVIVLNAATMGRGDDVLGEKLMGSFLRTLAMSERKPDTIVFYNAAVKLLAPDRPELDALQQLDNAGVDLLACITCLELFALTERLAVGQVSNMREITERLLASAKVLSV
jgi:selenium metabolism protein YedF